MSFQGAHDGDAPNLNLIFPRK